MLVELQIFSGRRNPSWRMDAAERSLFLTLLATIRDVATSRVIPEHLGYRGLVVTCESNEPGHFTCIHIYHTIVTEECGNEMKHYRDMEKKMEEHLLEAARNHLEPDLWYKLKGKIDKW